MRLSELWAEVTDRQIALFDQDVCVFRLMPTRLSKKNKLEPIDRSTTQNISEPWAGKWHFKKKLERGEALRFHSVCSALFHRSPRRNTRQPEESTTTSTCIVRYSCVVQPPRWHPSVGTPHPVPPTHQQYRTVNRNSNKATLPPQTRADTLPDYSVGLPRVA